MTILSKGLFHSVEALKTQILSKIWRHHKLWFYFKTFDKIQEVSRDEESREPRPCLPSHTDRSNRGVGGGQTQSQMEGHMLLWTPRACFTAGGRGSHRHCGGKPLDSRLSSVTVTIQMKLGMGPHPLGLFSHYRSGLTPHPLQGYHGTCRSPAWGLFLRPKPFPRQFRTCSVNCSQRVATVLGGVNLSPQARPASPNPTSRCPEKCPPLWERSAREEYSGCKCIPRKSSEWRGIWLLYLQFPSE